MNRPARVAFITGATGQDGSYLAELLLGKGYVVHGLVAGGSGPTNRVAGVHYHTGDLADGTNFEALLWDTRPAELYHLAAQSHVQLSFEIPVYTADVTGLGTLRWLEAIRNHRDRTGDSIRFYQASSSEMFGKVSETPQTELTPFHPRSPYACAKVFAYWQTINHREAYNLFACNGILFNHESPRRGETFVTRKITRAAARIKVGLQQTLKLGNLEARRDWGFAGDYVEAMWLMLQQDQPDDFVIATGETHSVREFLEATFNSLNLDWQNHVELDQQFLRPSEVDLLRGDPSKARKAFGWSPKVGFSELVRIMVEADLLLARRELQIQTLVPETV